MLRVDTVPFFLGPDLPARPEFQNITAWQLIPDKSRANILPQSCGTERSGATFAFLVDNFEIGQ